MKAVFLPNRNETNREYYWLSHHLVEYDPMRHASASAVSSIEDHAEAKKEDRTEIDIRKDKRANVVLQMRNNRDTKVAAACAEESGEAEKLEKEKREVKKIQKGVKTVDKKKATENEEMGAILATTLNQLDAKANFPNVIGARKIFRILPLLVKFGGRVT
jgi:hypothetical protein